MANQTPQEHKERHESLHKALDELFADYIDHHPDQVKFLQSGSIKELIEWSHEQTLNPTEKGI